MECRADPVARTLGYAQYYFGEVDRGEFGVKLGAKAVDDSYDRTDPGSNQPVFDGCGTGLVGKNARMIFS